MTSRERLLAAIRSQPVDHVPFTVSFWNRPRHRLTPWNSEEERLAFYARREWDAYVCLWCGISPSSEVRVDVRIEKSGETVLLHQTWHTPAATLHETLRVSDDWPEAMEAAATGRPIGLLCDFRTARYLEWPFKTAADLDALPYVLPDLTRDDEDRMVMHYRQARALADRFNVPVFVDVRPGLDWMIWLFPPQEAVLCAMDKPEIARRILSHVERIHSQRIRTLLEEGIDGVIRSGWYESADLWSPALYRELAAPNLRGDLQLVKSSGKVCVYLMDSGVIPLLDELERLEFDCLAGVDPATGGGTDLALIRRRLPGKALWGGISGPLHLGRGSPLEVELAVERAFSLCGKKGFILGPMVGYRHNWPWENLEACERTWQRLRDM